MRYDQIKTLEEERFRRLTGVKPNTFSKMLDILTTAFVGKRAKGGWKSKLSLEDQLLMSLEYTREYRTYFHIGQSYGVSESSAYKTVRWVEDTLVKHPDFALPGRKVLLKRFKIIADKYENRRKRFGLRFNLIAGIYNWEIKNWVSKEVFFSTWCNSNA